MYELKVKCKYRKLKKKRMTLDNGEDLEVDLPAENDTPVLWVRPDPDLQWGCRIVLQQPSYMWLLQLVCERDNIGQLEAIRATPQFGDEASLQVLFNILSDERVYHVIRTEAAIALAQSARPQTQWKSLEMLLSFLQSSNVLPTPDNIVRNVWNDLQSYYVFKVLCK